MAHKCYKFISKYANIENNQLKETEYQKVIVDILGLLFPWHIYELRYESISDEEWNDEESVDYSWHLRDGTTTLNLNKSTNKDNQYRIYFKNLKFEDINQHRDTLRLFLHKLILVIITNRLNEDPQKWLPTNNFSRTFVAILRSRRGNRRFNWLFW